MWYMSLSVCPFCWLVSVSFETDVKVPVDSLGPWKKTQEGSAVPQCVGLLANRCFQIGCHRCLPSLVLSKANENRWKRLLLLEREKTLRDMSQTCGKESFMISAVHRSARVFGCFFLLQKFWIVLFVCFLVFGLIYLRLKVVKKVNQAEFFFQRFSPLHIPDSPFSSEVFLVETKPTGCWLKRRFSAGIGVVWEQWELQQCWTWGEGHSSPTTIYCSFGSFRHSHPAYTAVS